jgi:hypothetical protein
VLRSTLTPPARLSHPHRLHPYAPAPSHHTPCILLIKKHPSPPSGGWFWTLLVRCCCAGAGVGLRLCCKLCKMNVLNYSCCTNCLPEPSNAEPKSQQYCPRSHVPRHVSMKEINVSPHRCRESGFPEPSYAEPKCIILCVFACASSCLDERYEHFAPYVSPKWSP